MSYSYGQLGIGTYIFSLIKYKIKIKNRYRKLTMHINTNPTIKFISMFFFLLIIFTKNR